MTNIEYAGLSDKGDFRDENQDNWVVIPDRGLYVVSDGMGGCHSGGLASQIVVEALPPMVVEELIAVEDLSDDDFKERLITICQNLSDKVRRKCRTHPELDGMGATVVFTIVRGYQAVVVHLGDSRAYLFRGSRLERLTQDHSLLQILLDQGEITLEEAENHPSRGFLTRCIGMNGEAIAEVRFLELEAGDRILLCTDGLTGALDDREIGKALAGNQSPPDKCSELVEMAKEVGSRDNITAVVLQVREV